MSIQHYYHQFPFHLQSGLSLLLKCFISPLLTYLFLPSFSNEEDFDNSCHFSRHSFHLLPWTICCILGPSIAKVCPYPCISCPVFTAAKVLQKLKCLLWIIFGAPLKRTADFQRASQSIEAEFKDCSVTSSFIPIFILRLWLKHALLEHNSRIFLLNSSLISTVSLWSQWYIFQRMFCFLEDSPIKKLEVSFLHQLFHIQLCCSFANKNFHSFLLMTPLIVDLVTSLGQYVQGWIHRRFIFYFNILVGTKIVIIAYFATLHSRAKHWPSMSQASRLYKACEQPLLWHIALIHPQSRDEGLMELMHRSSIVTQRFFGLW